MVGRKTKEVNVIEKEYNFPLRWSWKGFFDGVENNFNEVIQKQGEHIRKIDMWSNFERIRRNALVTTFIL